MGDMTIQVDEDVFAELQRLAVPLVDTANTVLRRLLKLNDAEGHNNQSPQQEASEQPTLVLRRSAQKAPPAGRPRRTAARKRGSLPGSKSSRAPKGVLLSEDAYELPILEVLVEHGGRAAATEVLTSLEPRIRDKLEPMDLEPISSGSIRWKNRAQFVRLRLVRSGDMAKASPRGIWEITERGRARVTAEGGTS